MKGKKILFLGATPPMCDPVLYAKQSGAYTIVTDFNASAPAKQFADQTFNVSTAEVAALIKIVKENDVDGIFTGFSEFNLQICRQLCDAVHLPFYASQKQIEVTTNKIKFKQLCQKYDLQVPKQYQLAATLCVQDLEKIDFPVIVKPADSYAAKGISVCNTKEQLILAYSKAVQASPTQQVIIEEYIDGDEVAAYYTVQNGKVSLSAVADRHLNKQQIGLSPLPTGLVMPSKHLEKYIVQCDHKIKRMFKDLQLQDGVFFLQSLASARGIHIIELGLRLDGGQIYRFIEAENKINMMQMLLRYSYTGRMEGWEVDLADNPRFHQAMCSLIILAKPGIIGEIRGLKAIRKMPEVLDILEYYRQGDRIEKSGTLRQNIIRIHIVAPNLSHLKSTITDIQKCLVVQDRSGQDMLLDGIIVDKL